MKTVLLTAMIMTLVAFTTGDPLTGRWESKPSEKGNVTGVIFKPDNSFEAYVNRKGFASGEYTLQDNIFSFTDNGCSGYKGIYKLIFFSNGDSLRFEPISDSCTEREQGMKRLIMGRVKFD